MKLHLGGSCFRMAAIPSSSSSLSPTQLSLNLSKNPKSPFSKALELLEEEHQNVVPRQPWLWKMQIRASCRPLQEKDRNSACPRPSKNHSVRRKSYNTHGLRQTTCMQRQKTEHDAIASSKFWRRFCSGTNQERKKEHALRCSSRPVRELSPIQQQFNEIAETRQQQMSKDWRQLFRRRRQIDFLLLRWPDDHT